MLQDEDYETSGAKIVSTKEAFGQDIVLKVRPPKIDPEAGHFKDGARYFVRSMHYLALSSSKRRHAGFSCLSMQPPSAYQHFLVSSLHRKSGMQASQLCLPWTQ